MSRDIEPEVGTWYMRLDRSETFVVNAVDEDEGVIEVQHHDGRVEQLEAIDWIAMDLELSAPPEDWSAVTM